MQLYTEVLHFREGRQLQQPALAAAVELPPGGVSPAGETLLVVLVDLDPARPHRSREIRLIAAATYWSAPGNIVARLRRTLAEVNRYLVRANAASRPDHHTSGSITCAVFREEDLFLGQVGPGHTFLYHPDRNIELFPPEDRPLLPLGVSLPPVIHIGYATVTEESSFLFAVTDIAEVQTRERWAEMLSNAEPEPCSTQIAATLAASQVSGCAVLVRAQPTVTAPEPAAPPRRFATLWQREPQVTPASPTAAPPPPDEVTEEPAEVPVEMPAPSVGGAAPYETPPTATPEITPSEPAFEAKRAEAAGVEAAAPRSKRTVEIPHFLQRHPTSAEESLPARRFQLPDVKLPQFPRLNLRRAARESQSEPRRRARLDIPVKPLVQALLPGKIAGGTERPRQRVPQERPPLMGGLAAGLFLIVAFITLITYLQFGGAMRGAGLLEDALQARVIAYNSQSPQDWAYALELSEQVLTLDPQNTEAQVLHTEASAALDVLENAAVLSATPIMELGSSPAPRCFIVARGWIYLLNPGTDEVIGLPLSADGLTPASAATISILQSGQMLFDESVEHLVDLAWMEPGTGYPDGAVFIYGDNGNLYIYEPSLGPGNITRQRLEGELPPGTVTMIGTFGEQFYLIARQEGQILKYTPISGLYDSPPRPYFAPESAPQLQTALGMGLDERLYLLLGDGALHAYFQGAEDLSFNIQGLPDSQIHPTALVVERDPEKGQIYLGDPQNERVIVLDKRGHFLHQYRLPGDMLKQLESLEVTAEPHVLYLIAGNRLYAAPIPEFTGR